MHARLVWLLESLCDWFDSSKTKNNTVENEQLKSKKERNNENFFSIKLLLALAKSFNMSLASSSDLAFKIRLRTSDGIAVLPAICDSFVTFCWN